VIARHTADTPESIRKLAVSFSLKTIGLEDVVKDAVEMRTTGKK
jgi:hypothetical protein